MSTQAPGINNITSNDTLVITGMLNGKAVQQTFTTLTDKSTVNVTAPNELVNVTVGKNGNAIFAAIKKGSIMDMELRPLMGNVDHTFLNAQVSQWVSNPTSYVLMNATFVKNLGDGLGNTHHVSYVLTGGVVTKQPELMEEVEGGTDQAVAVYKLRFAISNMVID